MTIDPFLEITERGREWKETTERGQQAIEWLGLHGSTSPYETNEC